MWGAVVGDVGAIGKCHLGGARRKRDGWVNKWMNE